MLIYHVIAPAFHVPDTRNVVSVLNITERKSSCPHAILMMKTKKHGIEALSFIIK